MAQSYQTLIIRSKGTPFGAQLKIRYRKLNEVWSYAFPQEDPGSRYQVKDSSSVVSSNEWVELGAYVDDSIVQSTEVNRELEVLAQNANFMCYACFEAGKYDSPKLGEEGWFRAESKWGVTKQSYSSDFTTSDGLIYQNYNKLPQALSSSTFHEGDLNQGDQFILSCYLRSDGFMWSQETIVPDTNQLDLDKNKAYILGRIPTETHTGLGDYEVGCILMGVQATVNFEKLSLHY